MEFYPISQSGRFDIDPIPLLELEVGDTVSLDLNGFLTRGAPSVVWSVDGGALPAGLSLSAEGLLGGEVLGDGVYIIQAKADAGAYGVATQGVAFLVPVEETGGGGTGEVWAAGFGGEVFDYTDTAGVAWRAHRFLGTDQFVGSKVGLVETLIVAGGGGGGSNNSNVPGGGGGGGGVIRKRVAILAQGYTMQVGAGGSGAHGVGANGSNSSAFGLTALGGGAGASTFAKKNGEDGGCGGGAIAADAVNEGRIGYGGSGLASIPGSEWCGQNGGTGTINTVVADRRAGGGGGFSQRGQAHYGGDGYLSDMLGTAVWYSGGGGGGNGTTNPVRPGGQGGGGTGGRGTGLPTSGAQNTGGGGGGCGTITSTAISAGAGGSGVIIVRYKR